LLAVVFVVMVFVVMVFGRGGADNDGDNNDNNWSIKNEANQYSFKLFCEDFQQVPRSHIPDHSKDLILTDPPYSEEYLYLYKDLGRLAIRAFKPGGNLVFFVGHIIMDKVINIFEKYSVAANNNSETGLKYWWLINIIFFHDLLRVGWLYQGIC
jgi:DNA modification methylase